MSQGQDLGLAWRTKIHSSRPPARSFNNYILVGCPNAVRLAQPPGSPDRAGVARAGVEAPGSPDRAGVARTGVEPSRLCGSYSFSRFAICPIRTHLRSGE